MHWKQHRAAIELAMREPDNLVLKITYLDSRGSATERIVSPIRYLTTERLQVYCLGREAVRTLKLVGIMGVQFVPSSSVLAPEAIRQLCVHTRRGSRASQRERQKR